MALRPCRDRRHDQPTTKSHENVAYEIFYPDGPFAILPMLAGEDGRPRSAIVWSVEARDAEATAALPDRALAHEIEKRMGGFLGAVALAGPALALPARLPSCRPDHRPSAWR